MRKIVLIPFLTAGILFILLTSAFSSDREEVTFFFDDADVYEVIHKVFGEVLKVNYVVDPKVKGRVNFRTTNPIPKDDVLPTIETVLRLSGIAVVKERGLYIILPIGDVPKEPAPIPLEK